jgi:hypothetical protein
VFHTISIGLTLVLAVWRYIAIRWVTDGRSEEIFSEN